MPVLKRPAGVRNPGSVPGARSRYSIVSTPMTQTSSAAPADAQCGARTPHPRDDPIHPLYVRLTHWINALAILIMIGSGWQIYNASPLFPFTFPNGVTLGGWLAGALLWHFAAHVAPDRQRSRLRDRWAS